ncbi:hypothetical protein NYO67_8220 [Aspergillus flavus]|nr:hypothetical protein NYO67_8220 [Aspergillus flavus]
MRKVSYIRVRSIGLRRCTSKIFQQASCIKHTCESVVSSLSTTLFLDISSSGGSWDSVVRSTHADVKEYQRRELQKDHGFKTRYFSREDVVAKGKEVLTSMNMNEVMLDGMAEAIRPYFSHCYVTWNSGNFYTLVASNSLPNFKSFMTCLGDPAIPNEFVYGTVPRSLLDECDPRVGSSS